jgi:hypothetical protein
MLGKRHFLVHQIRLKSTNYSNFGLIWGLKCTGKAIGKFISFDDSYKTSSIFSLDQILVHLDPCRGFFESMELVLGEWPFT